MRDLRCILVVDDDTAMCEMIVSLLRESGFHVVATPEAEAALAALRSGCFQAVLSDIRMPGKSGFEFLGEVRAAMPNLPVILMTSFGDLLTADRARREGAFGCLSKPFSREDLLELLGRAVPGSVPLAPLRSGGFHGATPEPHR